jgi:hypothetical protein
MNKIEKILLEQLRRHSTDYIESAERGIVCDDLDVDGFIEETSKLLQANGIDTGEDKCHIQNVKASVLSDINKMIEKVEGWIDKDTSRRDKYLIHGQADGMRKAIHIIHQHLP